VIDWSNLPINTIIVTAIVPTNIPTTAIPATKFVGGTFIDSISQRLNQITAAVPTIPKVNRAAAYFNRLTKETLVLFRLAIVFFLNRHPAGSGRRADAKFFPGYWEAAG
jgi:hypothetical protein